MSERFAALAKRLTDESAAAETWRDVALLDETGRLAVAWALKEVCLGCWTTEPMRAKDAVVALQQLESRAELAIKPEVSALRQWSEAVAKLAGGDFGEVLNHVDTAAGFFDATIRSLTAAQIRNSKVIALAQLGRVDESESYALAIRDVFVREKDLRSAGKVELNLGSLLLQQDRFHDAAKLYRQASVRFARVGDVEHSILADIGLGDALTDAFELDEAIRAYERARQRANNRGLVAIGTHVKQSLGLLESIRGNPHRALFWLESARRDYETDADERLLIECERDLADVYLAVALYPEACLLYERNISALERVGSKLEQAWARLHSGYTLKGLGQSDEAIAIAEVAAAAFAEVGNRVGAARAYLLQADIALEEGDVERADGTLSRARAVFGDETSEQIDRTVELYSAKLAVLRGDLEAAESSLLALLSRIDVNSANALRSECFERLGWIAERQEDLPRAIAHYRDAAKCVEAQCSVLQSEEMQTSFRALRQGAFERLVATVAQASSVSDVLEAMERGRAVTFVRSQTNGENAAQNEQAQVSRARLNRAYRQLSKDIEEDEESAVSYGEIKEIEAELLEHFRRSQFVNAGAASGSSRGSIAIEDVQAQLQPRDACIEYFCVDDDLYIVAITQDAALMHKQPNAKIAERVRQCRFQLEALRGVAPHLQSHAESLLERARKRLSELGQCLLGPVAELLEGKDRLWVVAHSHLHYVPFAALEIDGDPILQRFEIAMLPSMRSLLRSNGEHDVSTRGEPSKAALLVGNTAGGLAHVAHEIDALAAIFQSSNRLLDEEATVERVQHAMQEAKVVHLACHGQFRADSPYFSALHFADGAITVRDISEMQLNADLVTLSACETGLSQLSPGDELLGLTRAFLRAGTKTVLNSLWAVDDAVTCSLMTEFYKQVAAGVSIGEALRSAQLGIRASHPHPYYWAGFSITGQPSAIF